MKNKKSKIQRIDNFMLFAEEFIASIVNTIHSRYVVIQVFAMADDSTIEKPLAIVIFYNKFYEEVETAVNTMQPNIAPSTILYTCVYDFLECESEFYITEGD